MVTPIDTTSHASFYDLVAVLQVDDRSSKLNFIQKISSHDSIGPLNCICLSKSAAEASDLGQASSVKRVEELKKSLFYYCDNRGVSGIPQDP